MHKDIHKNHQMVSIDGKWKRHGNRDWADAVREMTSEERQVVWGGSAPGMDNLQRVIDENRMHALLKKADEYIYTKDMKFKGTMEFVSPEAKEEFERAFAEKLLLKEEGDPLYDHFVRPLVERTMTLMDECGLKASRESI